jgi:CRP/FNR family transcriptional regulator, cyclic AMP receptor protein
MGGSAKPLRKLLEETHWLKELPESAKERVFQDAHESYFQEGNVVAGKGELANAWIGVAEGLLKISAVHRSGKVVMFTGIPEGGWVGEGSVFKRELRRYDIVAMRPSRVMFLPGSTFRWLLDTSLEFSHLIIARLNERLGQYISMVEIDRLSDPVARVARTMATLYNPVLYPHMGALLTLSQTELGELIGMSRQSIGAALKVLEAEGLVSTEYGGVVVLNLPSLIAYEEREPKSASTR